MGVDGLFPLLKECNIPQRINVSELAKKTVAVDAYGWLHKGVIAVADKLACGKDTDEFV